MDDDKKPFDTHFCKTKYNAYKILMDLGKDEVESRMAQRSQKDLKFIHSMKRGSSDEAEHKDSYHALD